MLIALLTACLLVGIDAGSWALDDSNNALERYRIALRDSNLTTADRIEVIEQMLNARRTMIAQEPDAAERVTLLADQATDLFFDLMPADGAHLTGIFGILSRQQDKRIRNAAQEIYECATQAERIVAQAILDLESAPDFINNPQLQHKQRTLAERERDRRIPFLRGIGALFIAEFNATDAERQRQHYETAVRMLRMVAEELDEPVARLAQLYAGLALARLGQFDDAEAIFTTIARDPAASPTDIFIARMGGVINRTMRGGATSGLNALQSIIPHYIGREHIFHRFIIADHQFLLRKQLAQQSQGEQRNRLLTEAFNSYTDLLSTDLGVPRETVRQIVMMKLTDAAALNDLPVDELPAIVSVARAEVLSHQPHTREQAIVLLERALAADELGELEQATALFVLGRALYEHRQLHFAAKRFIELAERYPADSNAERAIEMGVSIAAELHRSDPTDVEAAIALQQGLHILLNRYPNLPTIDRWRYAAGRFAMQQGRFSEAIAFFQQVTPAAAEWLDAHFMQAAAARGSAQKAALLDDAQKQQDRWRELLAVIDRVEPVLAQGVANITDDQRRRSVRYYLGFLKVFRAEALIGLLQHVQALRVLENIEQDRDLETEVLAEALKLRIASYQAMRQPEKAITEINHFAQTSPEQVGAVIGPMLASLQRDIEALLEQGRDDQAAVQGRRTLLPVAKILEQWLHSQAADDAERMHFGRRIADAYRLGGECEQALAWYSALLQDMPNAAELLLGRAECLFALGGQQRLADAMEIYKRLAAAGPAVDPNRYWLAQLRMVQILDRVNRNTNQIAPRIERLRQQDERFGGERYRRGFVELLHKYRQS